MIRSIVIGSAAMFALACGDVRNENVAVTGARLVGGTTDTGDPAVVVFQATGNDGGECTAVFVSTTVLLTAAHCVLTENGGPLTGATFRIYQGNDFSKAKTADWITIDPSDVHPHPQYDGDAHDIAALVLKSPVAVTPLPIASAPLGAGDVGKTVRLIGYGANVAGNVTNDGFGIKRQLTTTISAVDAGFVRVGKKGATACGGDSGGPALLEIGGVETIIGLDSYSNAATDCTGTEYYQRVDAEAAFIATYLPATPPAPPPKDDGDPDKPSSPSHDQEQPKDPSASSEEPTASADQPASNGGCSTSGGAPNASWLVVLVAIAMMRRRATCSSS